MRKNETKYGIGKLVDGAKMFCGLPPTPASEKPPTPGPEKRERAMTISTQ